MHDSKFRLLLLALAVLGLAGVAALETKDADAAGQTIAVMPSPNRDSAHRTARTIDQVVIHASEGHFWGSVHWLRNPRSHGSSHFIVSRSGEIVELVDPSDVAWHAGNRQVNAHSIGIEHEGHTGYGGFTGAQYEASARLLAYLSQRYGIELDRRHVIGHNEVPNPYGRGFGGVDHHTDPGRLWRWRHYIALARLYAKEPQEPQFTHPVPPPVSAVLVSARVPEVHERLIHCGRRRSVHFTTFVRRQRLTSIEQWRAKTCGRGLGRVDFLLDGQRVGSDTVWPFMYAGHQGLNTTELLNGWHTLTLQAHGRRHYRISRSIRVRVANPPFAVAPVGLADGQAVSGDVGFRAATNAPAREIELIEDGEVAARAEGHRLVWDASELPNGPHDLELKAVAADGRTATRAFSVLVANETANAAPAPQVVWQSLSDWQTVSGPVAWQALVDGGPVQQVEFYVDGQLRWTTDSEPYAFGGATGVWDTAGLRPGAHHLRVRAVGSGGGVGESRAAVFVSR